jgi:hypothetical protein
MCFVQAEKTTQQTFRCSITNHEHTENKIYQHSNHSAVKFSTYCTFSPRVFWLSQIEAYFQAFTSQCFNQKVKKSRI